MMRRVSWTKTGARWLTMVAASLFIASLPVRADEISDHVKQLRDRKSARSREIAAEALGELGPKAKRAVTALLRAAKDKEVAVQRAVITALGCIAPGDSRVVRALLKATKDRDTRVRSQASSALSKISPEDDKAIQALEKAFGGSDQEMRRGALAALLRLRPEVYAARVQESLKSDDPKERRAAVETVEAMGVTARNTVPVLLDLLRDGDRTVVNAAKKALLKTGVWGEEAEEKIAALFDSSDLDDRFWAYLVSWRLGYEPQAIVSNVSREVSSNDRSAQTLFCGLLGAVGSPALSAVPRLCELAEDDEKRLSREAILAVCAILRDSAREKKESPGEKPPDVLASLPQETRPRVLMALEKALSHPDREVNTQAAYCLSSLGPATKEIYPAILAAMATRTGWIVDNLQSALRNARPSVREELQKELSQNTNPKVRRIAATVLGDLGEEAQGTTVALLLAFGSDEDLGVRKACLGSVLRIAPREPKVVAEIEKILEESKEGTSPYVATVLTGLRGLPNFPPGLTTEKLERLLVDKLSHKLPGVQRGALIVLLKLNPGSTPAGALLEQQLATNEKRKLLELLRDLRGITKLPAPSLTRVLDLLGHRDWSIERNVISILVENASSSPNARMRLLNLLASPNGLKARHLLMELSFPSRDPHPLPLADIAERLLHEQNKPSLEIWRDEDPQGLLRKPVEELAWQAVSKLLPGTDRLSYLVALGKIGPTAAAIAVPTLSRVLTQVNRPDRVRPIAFPLPPGSWDGAPALLANPFFSSSAGPREIRVSALWSLGQMGASATSSVPFVVDCLKDRDPWVRSAACYALGAIGKNAIAAAPELIQHMIDPKESIEVRARAAAAISSMGDAAQPILDSTELINDTGRSLVTWCRGKIGKS